MTPIMMQPHLLIGNYLRVKRLKLKYLRAQQVTLVMLLSLIMLFPSWVIADTGANRKGNIIVLGDSISAAYGIDKEQGWVQLLQNKLQSADYKHYQAINASISGNTSGDGLARLPALLAEYQPAIVLVELGGNDGLRGYPVNLMKNNLLRIIKLSRDKGAKVLLAGIEIPPNYGQRYTEAFRQTYTQVATASDVAFLPFILEDITTQTHLMQGDGIHPTAEAQPIILNNIWPYLEPLLMEKEQE